MHDVGYTTPIARVIIARQPRRTHAASEPPARRLAVRDADARHVAGHAAARPARVVAARVALAAALRLDPEAAARRVRLLRRRADAPAPRRVGAQRVDGRAHARARARRDPEAAGPGRGACRCEEGEEDEDAVCGEEHADGVSSCRRYVVL
ncbi:hypothetical protein S40288_10625 [Stachybotrys chartarum IBT 40288]|nr:hypothetical protein S40288_10625 [Stachybotrys chartarum IBT 40288]